MYPPQKAGIINTSLVSPIGIPQYICFTSVQSLSWKTQCLWSCCTFLKWRALYYNHWYVTCLFRTYHMKRHLSSYGQSLDNLSGVRPRDPHTPESRLWQYLHLICRAIPLSLSGKTVGCSFPSDAYWSESWLQRKSCSVSTLPLLLIALFKAWRTGTSPI